MQNQKTSLFMIDGKPFFPLGMQAHNSSGYSLEELKDLWKACALVKANSCAIAVSWEKFEEEEGKFNESLVKQIILACRERGLKLALLWFGTWKNGHMKYAPQWVKKDRARFPRVLSHDGYEIGNLSSFSENTKAADKKAFCRLMEVIRRVDSLGQTVYTVQIENELGIVGRSVRDYGETAQQQYGEAVPRVLIENMQKDVSNKEFVTTVWNECGRKENSSWGETFGRCGDEFLQAYSMASFVEEMATAGKEIYNIPMYTNVWLDRQGFDIPGISYPSGEAVTRNLAIWRWVAPHLDMICPDLYVQEQRAYDTIASFYDREDNPLYVPETGWGMASALGSFVAIANNGLKGIHFFGGENIIAPDGGLIAEAEPMKENFEALTAVAPLLLAPPQNMKIYSVRQEEWANAQNFSFDGWRGVASFSSFPRNGDYHHIGKTQSRGRGLIFQTDASTFYLCGAGFSMRWRSDPHPSVEKIPQQDYQEEHFINYITVEEGYFDKNGEWCATRIRNGDETDFGVFVYPDHGAVKIILD